jgi:hypothetical protein
VNEGMLFSSNGGVGEVLTRDLESFDSMDRVAEWSDQRDEVEVENETDDWLWSVD